MQCTCRTGKIVRGLLVAGLVGVGFVGLVLGLWLGVRLGGGWGCRARGGLRGGGWFMKGFLGGGGIWRCRRDGVGRWGGIMGGRVVVVGGLV